MNPPFPVETLRPVLARYRNHEISAHVALLQMLSSASIEQIDEAANVITDSIWDDVPVRAHMLDLARLYRNNRERCAALSAALEEQADFYPEAESEAARIAHYSDLFDGLVRDSPEASVAAYSLGRKDVLERATLEIVDYLTTRGLVGGEKSILQIGCGIGRMEVALSPLVARATGIDISPEMIVTAKDRCEGLANVILHVVSGSDLRIFGDGQFDLVYAVDSFPYIVAVGRSLVEKYFSEAHRVLRAGGDFLILNFSYRDSPGTDESDVFRLAGAYGFEVLASGGKPFHLWDGTEFHLRRR